MRILAFIICLAALAAGATSCGSLTSGTKPTATPRPVFFSPDHADELAHAAMPDVSILPGSNWEVTARDKFDDNNDPSFDEAVKNEPACAQVQSLDKLDQLFGGTANSDEPPIGHAKLEFTQSAARSPLPTSVDTEVEIQKTVAEVEGAGTLMKQVFDSDQVQQCLLAAMKTAFAQMPDMPGAKIDVAPRTVSGAVPNNGITLAYNMHMEIVGVGVDFAMELYAWPRGNASVTAMFIGPPESINAALIQPVLNAFDRHVVDVGSLSAALTPAAGRSTTLSDARRSAGVQS